MILKVIYLILFTTAICFISCKSSSQVILPESTNTIVNHYGLIHTKGNRIVDKNDSVVALHGMSLFWSNWGGDFYNEECIKWLVDDWKCTVIRAACGIGKGGYLENPEDELKKISTVIDACIKYGIYVVVDWHDHSAQDHLQQSKEFFSLIAKRYGDKPNIIYEIYNEPLQVSWHNVIKPYCEEIIKTIRQYDKDNLIVAGTPTWSQDVDTASRDALKDTNVAYALHFYTSTHKQYLRDKAITAMNNGAALFITEFGTSEANGTGIIDYEETNRWLEFINAYNISTCTWSVFDKNETSAALIPGADPKGNWKDEDLSVSGKLNRNRIRSINIKVFDKLNQIKK